MSALRVLNVDDNATARYVKRRILAGAGHEVIDAASGADALQALEEAKPDLALVDMKLPDMSGFELTRRIRKGAHSQELPVIQITAVCVTADDERDGLESGADAYLTMPVEPARLLEIVDHVFRGRKTRTAPGTAGGLNTSRMHIVDAFVRANLHRRIMLKDLAAVTKLSPFHFTRAFKATTGETPHSYVVRARLHAAMLLLSRTDLPVAEVSKRLAFRTAGHFTALFRKKTGFTPTEYRAQHGSK